MKFFTLIFSIFFSSFTFSQEVLSEENSSSSINLSAEIDRKIDQLITVTAEKYLDEVDQYRSSFDEFIEYKKKVCLGQFSTSVIGELKFQERSEPLSREERKLCFRELKNKQIRFINNLFIARKNFSEFIHKKKIDGLILARDLAIKRLNKKQKRRKSQRKKQ